MIRASRFQSFRESLSKLAIFWKHDYNSFDDSRTEFRANIIRLLRTMISLLLVGFMIIVFPFQAISLVHIIAFPSGLVINFLISTMLLKLAYKKYRKYYITFLYMIFASIAFELAVADTPSFSKFKMALIGLNVGLIYSTFLVLEFPMSHLITVSLFFCVHIIFRASMMDIEAPVVSHLTIIFLLCIINYFYFRHETLKYNLWNDLQKKYQQLSRFQKLIKVFPNQIVLINNESWQKKEVIYCNQEIFWNENEEDFTEIEEFKTFNNYSTKFFIDEALHPSEGGINVQKETYSFEGKSLNHLIDFKIKENKHNGEFYTFIISKYLNRRRDTIEISNDKVLKFEIKIGWINWGEDDVLLLLFNDISNVDEIRHLKALHHDKDKLLGSISHELRTPLNGIIGMIDVSDEELGDGHTQVKQYLNIARSSAKMLFFLINNILDMALIQRGTLETKNVKVSLKSLIDPIVDLMSVEIKNKGLALEYESDIKKDLFVFVEPIRFQQILVNLLKNACKFTQKGFVKLSVKINSKDASGRKKSFDQIEANKMKDSSLDICSSAFGTLIVNSPTFFSPPSLVAKAVIVVEDSGEGIPKENIDKIFSFISKKETNAYSTGVGLGLNVSQHLAKSMFGGMIKVHSVYQQGSKFWFSLNAYSGNNEEICQSRREVSVEGKFNEVLDFKAPFTGKNFANNIINVEHKSAREKFLILFVDDDPVNHLVVDKYLNAFKDEVLSDKAYNGQEALNQISVMAEKNIFYDLILMDYDMPVMNGLEASQKIRGLISEGVIKDSWIVAFTANVSVSDRKAYIDHGINEIWAKPISKVDFTNKVREVISKKNFGQNT